MAALPTLEYSPASHTSAGLGSSADEPGVGGRGPRGGGWAQGEDKHRERVLPALVSGVAAWAACALRALWGSAPVWLPVQFVHSLSKYFCSSHSVLGAGNKAKQSSLPLWS